MGNYDVIIHKTGSTYHIATPPEKDLAATTVNVRRKFGEVWLYGFRDMRADRQIHHNNADAYLTSERVDNSRVGEDHCDKRQH